MSIASRSGIQRSFALRVWVICTVALPTAAFFLGALCGAALCWRDSNSHTLGGLLVLDLFNDMRLDNQAGYHHRYFAQTSAINTLCLSLLSYSLSATALVTAHIRSDHAVEDCVYAVW